jgi:hypothetical protein
MAEASPLRRRMIKDMTVRNCRRRLNDPTSMRSRSSAGISAARRVVSIWKMFARSRYISSLRGCPGGR